MAVDAKAVKELRDKTAAPMMDCREALQATGCDMEKAIIFIATTLSIGIIFWFMSKMMFQALMGMLLAIILIFNMLGALFIVPSLLLVFKPKFITKEYKH